ncbi:MAG: hypothetical protein AB7O57_06170 [Hyphomicrobiaceae bacterium]
MTARTWHIWLIALALVAKALLPAGYMLSFAEAGAGSPGLVICTGGAIKPPAPGSEGLPSAPGTVEAGTPCLAAMAVLGHVPSPTVVFMPVIGCTTWTAEPPSAVSDSPRSHAWMARAPPTVLDV